VKSFPLDIQHVEYEGEVQRSIILFFNVNENLLESVNFNDMKNFLKNNLNCITSNNIINFVENIHKLVNKVIKKKEKEFFTSKDAINDLSFIDNNFQNQDEISEEENNNEETQNEENKEKDMVKIQSGECMLLFYLIFFFFYEFIQNNLNKFEIQNLIIHKKICDLLNKFETSGFFFKKLN
jgi:hypothetical protein